MASNSPGKVFFTGFFCRNRLNIYVTRDVHSSLTTAEFIENGTAQSLRDALLITVSHLWSPICVIRIDLATGFQSLRNDIFLQSDFGFVKSKNSNSVNDKAIRGLEY